MVGEVDAPGDRGGGKSGHEWASVAIVWQEGSYPRR
jgi:hypothetical protein